jgi:hypothetical protein
MDILKSTKETARTSCTTGFEIRRCLTAARAQNLFAHALNTISYY